MDKMNVLQRLAPNYWLGYYAVYLVTLIFLCARHRRALLYRSDEGYIITLAAIYTASVGTALTSAIIAESEIRGSDDTETDQAAQRRGAR